MRRLLFILIFLFQLCLSKAQVKRSFDYKGQPIELLAQNNRMENSFSFPGMRMFIIVGEAGKPLDSIYTMDKLRQIPITGMNDYACFYYLQHNSFFEDSAVATFLNDFITYSYKEDFINRNSVHLVWNNGKDTIPCKLFNEIKTIISSVNVLSEHPAILCDTIPLKPASVEDIWQTSHTAKTSVTYTVPGLLEIEEKENEKRKKIAIADYSQKKRNIFFQFTTGSHHIGNKYKTAFDTTTLVDFTKYKMLWNLSTGYYFTNRLFANIDFAFIYSGKQKNIDGIDWGNGITVRGSGYAGAMLRYGVGIGWLPYSKNRLDILLNIEAGRLSAIAGGGDATRTIGGGGSNNTNIVKQKEKNLYYNLKTGMQYRLGNSLYFTSNFQYCISTFKQPIGSVSAFTGWSYNLGIGFTIPTKNKQ